MICWATTLDLANLSQDLLEGFTWNILHSFIVPRRKLILTLKFLTFLWSWHLLFWEKCLNNSWFGWFRIWYGTFMSFYIAASSANRWFVQFFSFFSEAKCLFFGCGANIYQYSSCVAFMTDFWAQWFIVTSANRRSWRGDWNYKVYIALCEPFL